MRFQQGATLGAYEILSLLGAGGMGEVYRARDPRLGREVAIKVLPEELARDGERLARFEREARALAALNHPNVATLHGFERAADAPYLVMELVEGEDLAARIARGPIPIEEAMPLFLQIAEGLEAAHEKGILHRDLKPANVKIGPEGRVKILDFGLAKAMLDEHGTASGAAAGAGSLGDLTHSPTLTAQATRAGTLLGTAAYMSPEQARGLPADPRADVWAFGCCFYEALTGERPFGGEDAPQTLASVLKDTPDWSALPAELPPNLAVLVRRCLEKNRRARIQSVGDLRLELQESLTPPSAVAHLALSAGAARDGTRDRLSPRWRRRAWLLASSAALAALAIGFLLGRRAPAAPSATPRVAPVLRVPVALPAGVEIPYGYTRRLAISPDGRRIAYVGRSAAGEMLYVQDLEESGTAKAVAGTEGATIPFFSPDGDSLGFLRRGINVAPLGGGEPRNVAGASLVGGNAAWLEDGWIVYSDGTGGVNRVAATGGSPEVLLEPVAGEEVYSAQYLPGKEHLLHQVSRRESGVSTVVATTLASGERTVLFEGGFAPRYFATGHLFVAQEDLLLAMTLDARTLQVGPPVPVLRGLTTDAIESFADFAVSESGTLAYLTGALEQEGWLVRLTPDGKRERLSRRPTDFDYLQIAVSPDGGRVALSRNDGDIWTFDLTSRDLDVRVTTDPAGDWQPKWEPDGDRLTFASATGGGWSLYSASASGLGEVVPRVEERHAQKWPSSWSPDGGMLLFYQFDVDTQNDIWQVPRDRPDAAQPFLRTPFNESLPHVSPDGAWVAYASDEPGRLEIYVTSYPDRETKRKISRDGGVDPRWSAAGDRLFYRSGERVMVVAWVAGRGPAGEPELFVEGVDAVGTWDVTPDGRAVIALERRPPPVLHLVQNWFEELKRLVPPIDA